MLHGLEQRLPVYPEDDGRDVLMQPVPLVQVSPGTQDWYGASTVGCCEVAHPVEMHPEPSGQVSPGAQEVYTPPAGVGVSTTHPAASKVAKAQNPILTFRIVQSSRGGRPGDMAHGGPPPSTARGDGRFIPRE